MKLIRHAPTGSEFTLLGVTDHALLLEGMMLTVWSIDKAAGVATAAPQLVNLESGYTNIADFPELHLPAELRDDPWRSVESVKQVWALACDVFDYIGAGRMARPIKRT